MPLCYVEHEPRKGSPAHKAGLRAGDAIMSFGHAKSFEELPAQIRAHVPVVVSVIDRFGEQSKCVLTPRPFDPNAPNSLLGCHVTDICPAHFRPHPAENTFQLDNVPRHAKLVPYRERRVDTDSIINAPQYKKEVAEMCASCSRQPSAWHEEDEPTSVDYEPSLVGYGHDVAVAFDEVSDVGTAIAPTIAGTIIPDAPLALLPPRECQSSSISEVSKLSHSSPVENLSPRLLECPKEPREMELAQEEIDSPTGSAHEADETILFCCRLVLLGASALNLLHGCIFLAAPYIGMKTGLMVQAFQDDLWMLVTMQCVGFPSNSAVYGATQKLSDVSRSVETGEASSSSGLTLEYFVVSALVAAATQMLLAFGGVTLVFMPSRTMTRLRVWLHMMYISGALFGWLLLAAAAMYCVAFDFEAKMLLDHYWKCLGASAEHIHEISSDRSWALWWGSQVKNIRVTALLCATADASTVLGLFAVCHLIGWQVVLRTGVMLFSAASAAIGVLTMLMGVILKISQGIDEPWDSVISVLGAAVSVVSVLGHLAAKQENIQILLVYAVLQAVCASLLLAVSSVPFICGLEEANSWLEALRVWNPGQQHTIDSMYTLVRALQSHRLISAAIAMLIVFLLVMNFSMAFALRWVIAHANTHAYKSIVDGVPRPSHGMGKKSRKKWLPFLKTSKKKQCRTANEYDSASSCSSQC